jgi:hypothetical protein
MNNTKLIICQSKTETGHCKLGQQITMTTEVCKFMETQMRELKKHVQYKIRLVNGYEECVGMDLGRGGCRVFEVLALAVFPINCGNL